MIGLCSLSVMAKASCSNLQLTNLLHELEVEFGSFRSDTIDFEGETSAPFAYIS